MALKERKAEKLLEKRKSCWKIYGHHFERRLVDNFPIFFKEFFPMNSVLSKEQFSIFVISSFWLKKKQKKKTFNLKSTVKMERISWCFIVLEIKQLLKFYLNPWDDFIKDSKRKEIRKENLIFHRKKNVRHLKRI